jgi:2-polyprenyl-3-methyl-5-hydroxy-6-metoxy-1,4-benzoquinol methylase
MEKLLVVIANFGRRNDEYLARVLSEYRSMPYQTDIVVLTNVEKQLGPDVEVRVGLPARNPMSLPFGHKRVFGERQDAYDLYIYTEDDMLVTYENIKALLRISEPLPKDELLGFFQKEVYPDGTLYFPAVHGHFHWLPESVKTIGPYTYAHYTNEHSACYLLTREQLQRAITSGGLLVPPHEGKYTLLETATTDPYTQCGFRKVLCISHFDELIVAHLPNKYLGSPLGQNEREFRMQIEVLRQHGNNGARLKRLLEPETRVPRRKWSKDYYEPVREDMLRLLPDDVRNVLSIGCGWGATEGALVQRGVRVVGVPLDSVIAACAKSRGVETTASDFDSAVAQLSGERFDGILMSGIVHLMQNPQKVLSIAAFLLREGGLLIASFPNVHRLPFSWQRVRHPLRYRGLRAYKTSGLHVISRRHAGKWLANAGLEIVDKREVVPSEWKEKVTLSQGFAAPVFSTEYILVARKTPDRDRHDTRPIRHSNLVTNLPEV